MIFTSEEPAGGGPAAALVAGLRRALDESSDAIVTLPGDAPLAGKAASILLSRLEGEPSTEAVVGVDAAAGSSRYSLRCGRLRLATWWKLPDLAVLPAYQRDDCSMRCDPAW